MAHKQTEQQESDPLDVDADRQSQAVLKPAQDQVVLRMYEARDRSGRRLASVEELSAKFKVSTRSIRRAISRAREATADTREALPDLRPWLEESHEVATAVGWHGDDGPPVLGDHFANFHSELSEAWEEYRRGMDLREIRYAEDGKPLGFAVELADLLLRVFDTAAELDLPLQEALIAKSTYNRGREHRHGGKLA